MKEKEKKKKVGIKTLNIKHRASYILLSDIGRTYSVHNGQIFDSLTITEDMVGYSFGNFFLTKKLGGAIHKPKKKGKKK